MKSLKDIENDVHEFLINLANVRRVDVKSSVDSDNKNKVVATTFILSDTKENRHRVYLTEQILMERHKNVLFDFSISTLKEGHEQRSVESP